MFTFQLIAGLVTSSIHVISGPDHLAAVTPLVIETEKKAWKIGLSWGFGHIFGMLLIGILLLLFKDNIPLADISNYSEQIVGIVLIGVGLWSLYLFFRDNRKHTHIHTDETPYIHSHTLKHFKAIHSHNENRFQSIFSSFGIGVVHGLAGIAHIVLLVPVLSFDGTSEGVLYIIGFGIGTVVTMIVYTFILGRLTVYAKLKNKQYLFKGIRLAGCLFAILVGLVWLIIN